MKKRNSILSLLYKGTTTIQDFQWDSMKTIPINNLISMEEIGQIRKLIMSPRYSGNSKLKLKKIDSIMNNRGFVKFAGGTNRVVYTHPNASNAVFKVALDSVGINDNPAEYYNQEFLKPYCCKVFECSPCGTIASFEKVERLTTFEEFYSISDDYFYILSRKILGKYVMEDIGVNYFMNIGIRKGCYPVILDFPYLFKLDGEKLKCRNVLDNNTVCNGEIDYDSGFNKLVCGKCGREYRARDLSLIPEKNNIFTKQEGGKNMGVIIKLGDEIIENTFSNNVKSEKSNPNAGRMVVTFEDDVVYDSNINNITKTMPAARENMYNQNYLANLIRNQKNFSNSENNDLTKPVKIVETTNLEKNKNLNDNKERILALDKCLTEVSKNNVNNDKVEYFDDFATPKILDKCLTEVSKNNVNNDKVEYFDDFVIDPRILDNFSEDTIRRMGVECRRKNTNIVDVKSIYDFIHDEKYIDNMNYRGFTNVESNVIRDIFHKMYETISEDEYNEELNKKVLSNVLNDDIAKLFKLKNTDELRLFLSNPMWQFDFIQNGGVWPSFNTSLKDIGIDDDDIEKIGIDNVEKAFDLLNNEHWLSILKNKGFNRDEAIDIVNKISDVMNSSIIDKYPEEYIELNPAIFFDDDIEEDKSFEFVDKIPDKKDSVKNKYYLLKINPEVDMDKYKDVSDIKEINENDFAIYTLMDDNDEILTRVVYNYDTNSYEVYNDNKEKNIEKILNNLKRKDFHDKLDK